MTSFSVEDLKNELDKFPETVLQRLFSVIDEYEKLNTAMAPRQFEYCPKCGACHLVIIKAGKSGSGKQMLQYKSCGNRFTENYGTLSYYSHLDDGTWNEGIKQVLGVKPILEVSRNLQITRNTAFRMGHKIMHALSADEDSIQPSCSTELDEKYVLENHKGKPMKDIKGRKRSGVSDKRGISNDQVCILAGCQREGISFLRSYNVGRPSADEVNNLKSHIQYGTFIWTDASNSYNKLISEIGGKDMKLKPHNEYK